MKALDELVPLVDRVEHTGSDSPGLVLALRSVRGRTPEALIRFDDLPHHPRWIIRLSLRRLPR